MNGFLTELLEKALSLDDGNNFWDFLYFLEKNKLNVEYSDFKDYIESTVLNDGDLLFYPILFNPNTGFHFFLLLYLYKDSKGIVTGSIKDELSFSKYYKLLFIIYEKLLNSHIQNSINSIGDKFTISINTNNKVKVTLDKDNELKHGLNKLIQLIQEKQCFDLQDNNLYISKAKKCIGNLFIEVLNFEIGKKIINIIDELKKQGKTINKIYFCPYGDLSIFPFHAIKSKNGKFLIENFPLSIMPILNVNKEKIEDLKDALIIDIDLGSHHERDYEIIQNHIKSDLESNSINLKIVKDPSLDELKRLFENSEENSKKKYLFVHLSAHGAVKFEKDKIKQYIQLKNHELVDLSFLKNTNTYIDTLILSSCLLLFSELKGIGLLDNPLYYLAFNKHISKMIAAIYKIGIRDAQDFVSSFLKNYISSKSFEDSFQKACQQLIEKRKNDWIFFTR